VRIGRSLATYGSPPWTRSRPSFRSFRSYSFVRTVTPFRSVKFRSFVRFVSLVSRRARHYQAPAGGRGAWPLPRSHPLGGQCGSDVASLRTVRRPGPVLVRRFVRASVRRAGSCCCCLFPLPTTAVNAHSHRLVH